MSSRTDVDQLAQLPEGEFTERVRAAFERMELRSNRALAEHRDLAEREKQLSSDDHDELEALQKAEAVREHRERVTQAIAEVTEQRSAPFRPTLLVSDKHLEEHAAALREGRPYGAVEVETRARVTVAGDLGSAGAWDPGAPRTNLGISSRSRASP